MSYATHEVTRLGWELAECEAQVARTLAAEREHLFGPSRPGNSRAGNPRDADLDSETMRDIVLSDTADIAGAVAVAKEAAYWRKANLLQRYRREAERRRRKAQFAYCAALVADDPDPHGHA
ncbi:hypothetical protein ACFSUD_18090 [Sulfitobacter aestuarii]|uniref:Aldehyde dehydrogenase domain-containing protein n=1 Tax=Sulfitobacter aestuarii TaxID=2161676 RepID=A0ABW5U947_9RHOB